MEKVFYVLLIFYVSFNLASGQVSADKYTFPIHPGDKTWKETRYPERTKMLLIPESTLKKLSNVQLIGACFEYPFWGNLFAFNTIDEGFKNISTIFNGYNELFIRKNIASDLIDFYSDMDAFKFKSKYTIYNESEDPMKFLLVEYLLSRDQIINNLNQKQKGQLFLACKEKYELEKYGNIAFEGHPVFSNGSLLSTMVVISKLALTDKQMLDGNITQECQDIVMAKNRSTDDYEKIIKFLANIYK
jgi:hypothetical protein